MQWENKYDEFLALEKNENIVVTVHIMITIMMVIILIIMNKLAVIICTRFLKYCAVFLLFQEQQKCLNLLLSSSHGRKQIGVN